MKKIIAPVAVFCSAVFCASAFALTAHVPPQCMDSNYHYNVCVINKIKLFGDKKEKSKLDLYFDPANTERQWIQFDNKTYDYMIFSLGDEYGKTTASVGLCAVTANDCKPLTFWVRCKDLRNNSPTKGRTINITRHELYPGNVITYYGFVLAVVGNKEQSAVNCTITDVS